MDDRLRALGRAARAEVEATLDLDAELAGLAGRTPTPSPSRSPRPSRAAAWLAAAAVAAGVAGAAVWLVGTDDAIRTADPATTLGTPTAPAGTSPPDPTAAGVATTVATSAIPAPVTGTCTDIKAHDVGVGGIAGLIVDARLADRAPAIAGCLDAVPAQFDGSPGRCWSCAGQRFADVPVRVVETESGYAFDLAASTPDGDDVVDAIETWRFDLVDGLLRFDGVTFTEPLVSRSQSLATITAYFDAIAAGDWMAAARMLDDGAQSADERADLRRLELDDYSAESVAAALQRWCTAGCSTERPAAADLEFNGYSHDLVRSGERIRVRWYEGALSIDGLPPRLPAEPAAEPVDWRDLPWEGTSIERPCVDDSCARLVTDPVGTPISYDPTTRQLVRHGVPSVGATLPAAYGDAAWLVHAGPAGVVYLQVAPTVPAELAADVVAVTLTEGDAGREIGRWSDIVDEIGDSELVATAAGLVRVDCCGPDRVRPAPGAEVLVPWLEPTGEPTSSTAPTIRATIDTTTLTVARTDTVPARTREWSVVPAAEWLGRGMPQVTPTFDGGFIAATDGGPDLAVIRGWPDGDVEQVVLDDVGSVVLDRSGRVLVGDGDRFVRVEVFPDRTVRPADRPTVDVETGTISFPDLADVSAGWTIDPVAFADAVRGPLAVNEQRSIAVVQQSATDWLVTVTTSGFFDDSVFADRWELVLRRGDAGPFAVVSGQWSQACQPARGHQDFRPELCV